MENRIHDSRDDFKKLILSVVDGINKEVELPMKGLHTYQELIESLGLKCIDYDTNGWTVDFAMTFEKDGKTYFLCGSLWDNDYFNFSIQ
jgi:hypothetical protein